MQSKCNHDDHFQKFAKLIHSKIGSDAPNQTGITFHINAS